MKFQKKQILGAFCALLACSMGLSGCSTRKAVSPSVTPPSEIHGLFVHARDNRDFPTEPGLSFDEVKGEIEDIVYFAAQNACNTLFFEMRPASDALYLSDLFPVSDVWMSKQGAFTIDDPLQALTAIAARENIQVHAMINPFYVGSTTDELSRKNPAAQQKENTLTLGEEIYWNPASKKARETIITGVMECASRYGVTGITIRGIDDAALLSQPGYRENLSTFLTELAAAMESGAPGRVLGVAFDGNTFSLEEAKAWVSGGSVDLLLPTLTGVVNGSEGGYEALLDRWQGAVLGSQAHLVPVLDAESLSLKEGDGKPYTDPYELAYQLSYNRSAGITESALSSYTTLRENPYHAAALLRPYYGTPEEPEAPLVDLSITSGFLITQPGGDVSTPYGSYFITGVSDPDFPLLLDGEELPRKTESGLFGVLVELPVGSSTFTFTQEEESRTVTITRTGGTATPAPITKLTTGSLYPTAPSAVWVGEEIPLSCTGPSGGVVTATVDGVTVTLRQKAAAAPGVPATFTGTLLLEGDYPVDETTLVGPISYTLTYNGKTSGYTSPASLYGVGEEAALSLEVADYMAGVTAGTGSEDAGNFLTTLKAGSREYATEDLGSHFALRSGGFIRKEAVNILTGKVVLTETPTAFLFAEDSRQETFTLPGVLHAPFYVTMEETGLTVTLYNVVTETKETLTTGSSLFSSITRAPGVGEGLEEASVYTFTLAPEKALWGWDVRYTEAGLSIIARKPPVLSEDYARPLSGIRIVLDPGHGGGDPGALGVLGEVGPHEADVNLAAALAVKRHLENLGATVTLTVTPEMNATEEKLSLFERMEIAEKAQADFFISLHHNSIEPSVDGNTATGSEVYYYTDHSAALAKAVAQRLTSATGRQNRGTEQSYYVVTKLTFCPAILTEIGFVVNPAEFEALIDEEVLSRTGSAVTTAVLDVLQAPQDVEPTGPVAEPEA